MNSIDEASRERAKKLLDRGYTLLKKGEFDEALQIAEQLKVLRNSGAFEIAALANAGKGLVDDAVRVLEDGVEKAPDVWLNWQLLGNYRADLARYSEAQAAYERALTCSNVWRASVQLNQAIMANRKGEHDTALELAAKLVDPTLRLQAIGVRMGALLALGNTEGAERLGSETLNSLPDETDDEELAPLVASLARTRLMCGKAKNEIRSWVADHLKNAGSSTELLAVIRDIDGLYSSYAQYYRLLVHGEVAQIGPERSDARGFFATYDVVADSPTEGLALVKALAPTEPFDNLSVEEANALGSRPKDPKGVYWCSGRVYYEHDK